MRLRRLLAVPLAVPIALALLSAFSQASEASVAPRRRKRASVLACKRPGRAALRRNRSRGSAITGPRHRPERSAPAPAGGADSPRARRPGGRQDGGVSEWTGA